MKHPLLPDGRGILATDGQFQKPVQVILLLFLLLLLFPLGIIGRLGMLTVAVLFAQSSSPLGAL